MKRTIMRKSGPVASSVSKASIVSDAEHEAWLKECREALMAKRDRAFTLLDKQTGITHSVQFSQCDWDIFKDPNYVDDCGGWLPSPMLKLNKDGYLLKASRKVHELIMKPPEGVEVGHINPDKLDLRRSNLRLLVHDLNQKESGTAARSARLMKSPHPHVYPRKRKDGSLEGWNVNVATREVERDEQGKIVYHKGGPQKGKPKLVGTKLKFFSASKHTLDEVTAIAATCEGTRYKKALRENKRLTGKDYVDLSAFSAECSFGTIDAAVLRSKEAAKAWLKGQSLVCD